MSSAQTVHVQRLELCEDVVLLSLERPDGFAFEAGQWVRLTVPTETGDETRTFSLASAPSDATLDIGTRLSASSFKRALARLSTGDEVSLSGPGGRLRIPAHRPLVFLAGGVGITPVRSMLRDAVARGDSLDEMTLLYGNRHEDCVPYREEIEALSERGLSLVHVLETAAEDWTGERGFIDAPVVTRHVDPADAWFVVSGPPVMVVAMTRVLDGLNVAPERRTVESFGSVEPVRSAG